MCVCVCVWGCVLVMDVSLFLFVVSQENSRSHAVNCTHSLSHAGPPSSAVGEKVGASRKRDERVAGVNLIPLGPDDMPETHSGGPQSLLSQILYSLVF